MALHASFSGKRVLVTGGAKGLGRSVVERLHEDEAIVFTIDFDRYALDRLREDYPKITTAVVDLMDWDRTRKVVTAFGRMDYLVNNAGVLIPKTFFDIQEKDVERMNAVNYNAIINVSQVVVKGMIEAKTGGSIVNLASVVGRFACSEFLAYSSTKAAVEMLTKSMAMELGPYDIRVNCISPSAVDTAMLKQTAARHTLFDRMILKRLIEPTECADLILFLLSPLSSMITGDNVLIDGGYSTN